MKLISEGVIKDKTNYDFHLDMREMILRQYAHYTEEKVYPASQYGDFFPAVCKDPSRFIQQQPKLKETIKKLRDAGKLIFLATNSHEEYMEIIMKATLGDDWKSYFDLINANCRKPAFFGKDQPFYTIDKTADNIKGPVAQFLVKGETYLQGNTQMANEFFCNLLGK